VNRVAVVVPCFDSGETLRETLRSVRGEPCELVVVDDGSRDPATLAVLADAEAAGVRIVRRENGGVAAARMTGVHATSAPYVFPLDADDVLVPGALAALADALDRDPEAQVAWGWVANLAHGWVFHQAAELDPWLLTYTNKIPVMSLVRRSALLDAGGWRDGLVYEDWDLWLTFAERGWKGIRVPLLTARYRSRRDGRWSASRAGYGEAVAQLRRDHPRLWAERDANRRRSGAPRRLKLFLPLVERLPLSPLNERRAGELLVEPSAILRPRLASRR
jgi:glycosyltransferase involved in cell wall biosynthesis